MERRRQYLIYRIAAIGDAFTHIRIASPVTLPGDRSCGTFIDETARAVHERVQWLRYQIQTETDEIKQMVGESVRGAQNARKSILIQVQVSNSNHTRSLLLLRHTC